MREIYTRSKRGRDSQLIFFQAMSSGNILGALYQNLSVEIKIQTLGEYYQNRHQKGGMYNIMICSWECRFTKGKFSYIPLTLQFNLPLQYIISH